MKIVGQTLNGNMLLIDLGRGKGQIVDLNTGRFFPVQEFDFLSKRFTWSVFEDTEIEKDLLEVLKEEGIGA